MPSARPGSLAPHAWLHDGSSLYDHFGSGFTLVLANDADGADVAAVRLTAGSVGVPLAIVKPTELVVGELYQARYTLVRPDQHVAWRGNAIPDEPERLFTRICGQGQTVTA